MSDLSEKYLHWLKTRDVYCPLNDTKSNQFSDEFLKENAAKDKQLSGLAEAAENMLELLVNNAPIDGLWSSDIEEWDELIKEAKGS